MHNLMDFLTDFATSPQKQLVFMLDPDVAMRDDALTEAEKGLLKRGRHDEIAFAFADKEQWPSCTFVDPGPDPTLDPDTPPDEGESDEPELPLDESELPPDEGRRER